MISTESQLYYIYVYASPDKVTIRMERYQIK
jgi:hypothetical protein